MNTDNETEQLNIEPDRIIYILLKHLMYLKNELAYANNKMSLIRGDGYPPDLKKEANKSDGCPPDLRKGASKSDGCLPDSGMGENKSESCPPDLRKGASKSDGCPPDLRKGVFSSEMCPAFLGKGIFSSEMCPAYLEKGIFSRDGSPDNFEKGIFSSEMCPAFLEKGIFSSEMCPAYLEKGIFSSEGCHPFPKKGIFSLVEALSDLGKGTNEADWLHSVFEQGLIKALDYYIKNGNGQNTLYTYYSDFVKAVAEKNSLPERLKKEATPVRIEDTHILPKEIPIDAYSTSPLEAALYGCFPQNSKLEMRHHAAKELLFLHNAGKAKQTELRKLIGMSVSGFSKHLPRLIQYGLIKELPSKNYGLTDLSKQILLKTFGIAK